MSLSSGGDGCAAFVVVDVSTAGTHIASIIDAKVVEVYCLSVESVNRSGTRSTTALDTLRQWTATGAVSGIVFQCIQLTLHFDAFYFIY